MNFKIDEKKVEQAAKEYTTPNKRNNEIFEYGFIKAIDFATSQFSPAMEKAKLALEKIKEWSPKGSEFYKTAAAALESLSEFEVKP